MLLLSNKKNITIFLLCMMGLAGFNEVYPSPRVHGAYISDFNSRRDREGMLDIFQKNWRALTGDDSFYSEYVENIMKNRKPDKTMPSIGRMDIKVMREDNKFAGFTAYYKETSKKGMVLFLAVGHEFRGKGYGKILIQHAIKNLLSKGSKSIGIWVAETNLPAKRIYEELGFSETPLRQGAVVYLEYCP